MDRLKALAGIIKKNLKASILKLQIYPGVSNRTKQKLAKNFDRGLNTDHIVAFFDTGMFIRGKNGFVFMLEGVYYKAPFKKTYYFNYKDIINISTDSNKITKNNKINILFSNKNQLVISGSKKLNSKNMRLLLLKLKAKVSWYRDLVCFRESGKVEKLSLTVSERAKCHGIIHSVSVAAGGVGAGLAQIPTSDTYIITPAQIGMIISLGKVFDMDITNSGAKSILTGIGASYGGRFASQVLVGWIPGVGNAVNAATAVTLTETIGWLAVAHFKDQRQKEKVKYQVENMKLGYEKASKEFESKYKDLAEKYIQQDKIRLKEIAEHKELLSQYEEYIQILEAKIEELQANGKETTDIQNRLTNTNKVYKNLKGLKVSWWR